MGTMLGWLIVVAAVALVLLVVATFVRAGIDYARMTPEERHELDAAAASQRRSSAPSTGTVEVSTSRPTVPRVAGGMLLGGLPGALLGFAWRKKQRVRIRG